MGLNMVRDHCRRRPPLFEAILTQRMQLDLKVAATEPGRFVVPVAPGLSFSGHSIRLTIRVVVMVLEFDEMMHQLRDSVQTVCADLAARKHADDEREVQRLIGDSRYQACRWHVPADPVR
jgi:hypothetical protein